MNDMELFEKFEKYFADRGWTFDQAADAIGVSRSTLFNWKNGKSISKRGRSAILTLITDHAETFLQQRENAELRVMTSADKSKAVPLLSPAQAAQLSPSSSTLPEIEPGTEVSFMNVEEGDFAMIVAGESMTPWYPPGTRILVKRWRKPKTGNRVAVMLEDRSEPVFKNYVDLGDKFALLSINDNKGTEPIILDKMDKGETWYWVFPIGESVRDEFALDVEMKKAGIEHFWEKWEREDREG